MRKHRPGIVVCLSIFLMGVGTVYAQNKEAEKLTSRADKLFEVKNYSEALPLYLNAYETGVSSPDIQYKIGKCYSGSDNINERIKGIPYLEKALGVGIDPIPYHFYTTLGDLYLENEQVLEAADAYLQQLKIPDPDPGEKKRLEDRIASAKNARRLMSRPLDLKITRLGTSINSEFTEYNPVLSADEGVLAYTVLKPNTGFTRSMDRYIEEIYISYNKDGNWSIPEKVAVNTQSNYGTAGLSPDGQEMLIFIGDRKSGSIYKIRKEPDGWSRPTPLGSRINSKYLESTASITPDGKTLYFAGERPGGYGGLDIYIAQLQSNGEWGVPENLGPDINTRADEDAPFIHPNANMLFFTSNGHESMGGHDIFKTTLENGRWTKPKNMGYPINTVSNDNYFTLIADGSRGYFSSDRKGGAGGEDIYMMDMPDDFESIPLTMIKGRILDADSDQPIPTKIYMVDKQTNQKLDYVYHPNIQNGDYLVILPPNKNYDMIIESDGFLPYTLNIDVPNQTEFYELYQKIYLKTLKQFDVIVGQQVEVKNAFYKTHDDQVADNRRNHESALIKSDSFDVYDLMGDLIEAGDQSGIDYLVSLIMVENPIDEVDFDDTANTKVQNAKRRYYYDESDESKFEKKTIDDEVIYSLPTMYVSRLAEEQRKSTDKNIDNHDPEVEGNKLVVLFDAGKSELKQDFYAELDDMIEILKLHEYLGVEISGYASPEGDEEFNRSLSNERAISVLNYLNHRGLVRRRIIARGYGETVGDGLSKEENRRVEVRLINLNQINK